jgi:hypothetical protein
MEGTKKNEDQKKSKKKEKSKNIDGNIGNEEETANQKV